MDQSLRVLCDALKKIINQLDPQHHAVSFLLLTGKTAQGKTTLLRQSHYDHIVIHAERGADIYYSKDSVILELGESWLTQSTNLLQYTLKQLNKCHRTVRISGIILCVDINELFLTEPLLIAEHSKKHALFLERFGLSLGYAIDATIIFTKLDVLAGFCDFFQHEHASELKKPMGFSLHQAERPSQLTDIYKVQFDHFIETLGQRVIHKIHPTRSSMKRTLIRELPFQLAYLHAPILSLIKNISPQLFRLTDLYFTSAEQGGISLDRLNTKIQHEYGLTVQDQFPQSTNYQAYFIDGALHAFHTKTKRHAPSRTASSQQWILYGLAGAVVLSLIWISQQHLNATHVLDDVSKELLSYDALAGQQNKQITALYHLTHASTELENMSSSTLPQPMLEQLKTQLQQASKQHMNRQFLPDMLADVEKTLLDHHESQIARYEALKIYLMLGDSERFVQNDVEAWFTQRWPTSIKKLALLKDALRQPFQPVAINRQIVTDTRNYLNALPASYLYYSIAKRAFTKEKKPLSIDGFALASNDVPVYLTKQGFDQVLASLPAVTTSLQADNWVLARQDLGDLQTQLLQAYCYEYVLWWQHFMSHSHPLHSQDYQQARDLTRSLNQTHAITRLVELIQNETGPKSDMSLSNQASTLFNQDIASKFTELSFISHSAIRNLTLTLNDLERFLATLCVLNDQGKTAFTLTKARFQGDTLNNPLTTLYGYAQQLPDPVSSWTKQIADDTWFTLINNSKTYINQQWKDTVLRDYHDSIAQRYPFDTTGMQDIAISDFNRFFAKHGVLNTFVDHYLKPFLDTSKPDWAPKESNGYVLPISTNVLNELIRANIVTNMFFSNQSDASGIEFSLQKLSLDPIVGSLRLSIGENSLVDSQNSDSFTHFSWPQSNAKLVLNSIEGKHFELEESGPWAFFKMLQKVNVLIDEEDTANLQILFEVNGNSGRYLLKTENQVNPFTPGILNGFNLPDVIV